jgi:hypothetical protein
VLIRISLEALEHGLGKFDAHFTPWHIHAALGRWFDRRWFDLFVDFLVTKHGLAAVLQSKDPCFDPLHSYFLERIVPVCAQLLHAAANTGEIRAGQDPHELMRGVASLCAGAGSHHAYDARRLVSILIAGLRLPAGASPPNQESAGLPDLRKR